MAWKHVAVLLTLLFAGCLGTGPSLTPGMGNEGSQRPVVSFQTVAFADSGINPYQEAFAADSGFESRLAALNASFVTLQLSKNGTLDERLKADATLLQGLKPGQLYHFAGTRILAISFLNRTNLISPEQHVIFDTGHGTETSSIVAKADPDALIVMAQVETQICDSGRCTLDPSAAEGVRWASAQSWIDLISISLGTPANPPDSSTVHPEMQTFLDATRAAATNGKLVVVSAGNYPGITLAGYTAGPPWVIAAGGYEPANRGEAADASKGVDVIANVTVQVADGQAVNGTVWGAGTSFSAPVVTGTLSRALGLVRADLARRNVTSDLHLHNTDAVPFRSAAAFRAAMNASAVVVSATDYDPTGTPENDTVLGHVSSPAIPVFTSAQQGWGVIYEGLAGKIAQRVLSGDVSPPAGKASMASSQGQWQALREAYWQ